MKVQRKIVLTGVQLLVCLCMQNSFAAGILNIGVNPEDTVIENNVDDNVMGLPLYTAKPFAAVWGYGGNKAIGKAQTIFPLAGSSRTGILFGDFEGMVAAKKDNGWMLGAGAGYRTVIDDSYILGSYLQFDRNVSVNKHAFWVVNPGVEVLGYAWDFRINGYLPVNSSYGYGPSFYTQPERIYEFNEKAGIGVDAEIGRVMPYKNNLKVFVGGYYFDLGNFGNIKGVTAKLTYRWNNRVSFELRNVYDKTYHNATLFGLCLTWGEVSQLDRGNTGVASRIMEPIEHNISVLDRGYGVPMGSSSDW